MAFDPWDLWTSSSGVRLRGANMYQDDKGKDDGDSNGGFGPPMHLTDLKKLREAGANLVVYSVPGPYHVKTYNFWPAMAAHLDKLCDWAEDADLFVVIAARTGPGRGEGDLTNEDHLENNEVYVNPAAATAWAEMWRDVAMLYQNRNHIAGYDIMVEPHDHHPADWRGLAKSTIDAIRGVDKKTPILVSPGDWGTAQALTTFEPFSDPEARIVYTVHQYEPYCFTHCPDKPDETDKDCLKDCPDEAKNNLTTDEVDDALQKSYTAIREWRKAKNNAPVAVSEFGYNVSEAKENSLYFMKKQLEFLEATSAGHAAWLWEVAQEGYYAFDIKSDLELLTLFIDNWRLNIDYPSTCIE